MASLLFFLFLLYEAASEPEVVRVGPEQLGQDVTLPCDAGDVKIIVVNWTRSKPQPSKDILLWRDGHIRSPIKGRVQLVDGELKNGNVSLILKNVSREDVGSYECRVATAGSRRKKRAVSDVKLIKTVRLQMTENQKGDNSDRHNNKDGASTRYLVGFEAAAGESSGIDQVFEALHQDDLVSVMFPFMSHYLIVVMGFVYLLTLGSVLSGALKLLVGSPMTKWSQRRE
ncbi:uncharacterized protein LOC115590329 [Sparus aurata]|uniref:uncharacterized protein LOC115590329 n=1 Tax=Sparus aurata TaxID=8175 RepID=UPI0011C13CD3|nr:uncharacterized protein LOC115590329 [Sparus aurata]